MTMRILKGRDSRDWGFRPCRSPVIDTDTGGADLCPQTAAHVQLIKGILRFAQDDTFVCGTA